MYIVLRAFAGYVAPFQTRRGVSDCTTDMEAVQNFRARTELFTADAASDETLAGKLLSGKRSTTEPDADADEPIEDDNEYAGFLYAVFIRARDKAHATRMVLQRTFPRDQYLHAVCCAVFLGADAIAKKLRFSDVFQGRFHDNVQAMDSDIARAHIRDLSSAPHRFGSHTRPAGRCCLFIHAVVRTAQQILNERGALSDAGKVALSFFYAKFVKNS